MKRVLSIQDISCVGKCSLTVALPVISAAGLEAAILPTAILSAHTAFKRFTSCDLAANIRPFAADWLAEGITFDGIYTGYLGSSGQIEAAEWIFKQFDRPGLLRFVDPAMGDDGKLYTGFDRSFAGKMAKLCSMAEIIVPNLTEAAMMLGQQWKPHGYNEPEIRDMLKRLCGLGCPVAVLTGVSFDREHQGAAFYDCRSGEYGVCFGESLPGSFPGTGDVFASAVFSALMRGKALPDALRIAVNFTCESIKRSLNSPDRRWYGVDFEHAIPNFINALK